MCRFWSTEDEESAKITRGQYHWSETVALWGQQTLVSWSWDSEIMDESRILRWTLLESISSGLAHRPVGQGCTSSWQSKLVMCKRLPCGTGFEIKKGLQNSWSLALWEAKRGHWQRCSLSCNVNPEVNGVMKRSWGLAPQEAKKGY